MAHPAREPARFGPTVDGWRVSKPEEPEPEWEPAQVTCPDLDTDVTEARIVPFGVPSRDYRDLRAA